MPPPENEISAPAVLRRAEGSRPEATPRSDDRIGGSTRLAYNDLEGSDIMADIMDTVESREARTDLPAFSPGDTIKVHVKVKEGDKERIQIFQGIVISRKGGGSRQMFTVRKISGGVGVERMFPLYSPSIERIEVERHGRVRRAKLYYLRDLRGKAARIEEKRKG
jgi:large subunit ribosomal protein L19